MSTIIKLTIMKKVLLLIATVFGSLTLMAQQPERPILHNQFRDFVEFQKQQQKPQIEKKDGKVIITMSEEQFHHMQMMRQRNFHRVNFRQPMVCQSCKKCQKKQPRPSKGIEKKF